MRHVNYNLYQNTNTVILIETNVYRHNQEHFLFLLQKPDLSAVWEVPWVWQTRALMEEENSPCLALHPTQWGFQLIHRSKNCQMLLAKMGCLCLVWTMLQVQLWFFPVELYVLEMGELIAASVQVLSSHTGEYFVSHLPSSLLVGSNWHSR